MADVKISGLPLGTLEAGDLFEIVDVSDLSESPQGTSKHIVAAPNAGSFADSTFDIFNIADITKKITFNAVNITTAITRTITMEDRDVNLADYALLTGRSGGQRMIGGTAAADNLILESTSNVAKGIMQVVDPFMLATGTTVIEFSIDGTLAGDSDDAVPTEKAVKTYVDSMIPAIPIKIVFEFIATASQTVFTPLPSAPSFPLTVTAFRNGQQAEEAVDFTISGTTLTWIGTALGAGERISGFYNDAAGGGPSVNSVFGRTGVVVQVAGDYAATQVNNDSGVVGANVAAALDTLDGQSGVTSVFGRAGAVGPVANDYAASLVDNDSSVGGATVKDALETLQLESRFIAATDYNSNVGSFGRARSVGASAAFNFTFIIPHEAVAITALVVRFVPSAGAAGASKPIDFFSEYGAQGETINTHTGSVVGSNFNLGTVNTHGILDIGLLGLFSAATAGDICFLEIDHQGIGGSVSYLGVDVFYLK